MIVSEGAAAEAAQGTVNSAYPCPPGSPDFVGGLIGPGVEVGTKFNAGKPPNQVPE